MEISPLVYFIKRNFMGANITITLVSGETVTGEVVDGFDNTITLKEGDTTTLVSGKLIVSFA